MSLQVKGMWEVTFLVASSEPSGSTGELSGLFDGSCEQAPSSNQKNVLVFSEKSPTLLSRGQPECLILHSMPIYLQG